ncbi:MAG: prolipoprotein diacylglyceryl transferase [Desulfobacterales bacterium]|nr:prolipoprotein diacylglyceryl transferase [Desulfobacterales bacterium]
MHPILINIGPIPIRSYGFFIAIGFLFGTWLVKKEANRLGENTEAILDMSFWCLLGGIAMSRVFHIFTDLSSYLADPLRIFKIWEGGLVFYGGFIGAFIVCLIYIYKYKFNTWKIADIAAPAVALGHSIARIGCLMAGCCHGKVCDLPWAITFKAQGSIAPLNMPLHPTQIYSSISNFCIFLFLMYIRKKKIFDGQVFWIYVLIYAITRSIVELFRGDHQRGFFWVFSTSQTIGILMVSLSIFMLFYLMKKTKDERN